MASYTDDEPTPVVCDNGSGMVKCGFSGEDAPRCVFGSVVGTVRPDAHVAMLGAGSRKEYYVGDDALARRGVLSLRYPIEHGVVTNWTDMERVWHHTFYGQMGVDPAEHRMLLTEAPMNPKQNRERMAQIMFETFNVPGMYVAIQAVLSLYSAGRTTGIVVDAGDGVTHTVPVYEGYSMPHAVRRSNVAGRDLTDWMQRLLRDDGVNLSGSSGYELARSVKEALALVAADADAADRGGAELDAEDFEMPDGSVVRVSGTTRRRCGEALFRPLLLGSETEGMAEMAVASVRACDVDVRRELFGSVVLSGGTTMLRGLAERLRRDVEAAVPSGVAVRVVAPAERKYSVWIGGAILSCLSTFQNQWVLKREYDEAGPGIVHSKCF
jgi:actin